MTGRLATMISFRLGGADGVSVEAAKWQWALGQLGFDVKTVAGTGVADHLLPGLAIGAADPPSAREVEAALADADLVVVENLFSLPLNPPASAQVAEVLRGRPALVHNHDLPWQREQFAGCPPPADDPCWLQVTINEISHHQLAARGIESWVVRNSFDVDAPRGEGTQVRHAIGVSDGELLLLQPTRAIPRKNIGAGLALAEALGATYWLLGPAEDGFGPTLDRLVHDAKGRVVLGTVPGADSRAMADVYAACDLVALPSTWEGFGNPSVESAVHHKPLAVGHYPVAAELASFGFRWFAADDPLAVRAWLDSPAVDLLEHNHRVARTYFSMKDLPQRLTRLLGSLDRRVRFEGGR